MHIVDRRLNPGGKSLANRQRFIRRAKSLIRKAVHESTANRSIKDADEAGEVSLPAQGVHEPAFRRGGSGGIRDHLLPGNKEYIPGDTIPRPPSGGGGSGSEGSPDGDGQDDFRFALSRDEFVDLFLEDLELPDLAKRRVADTEALSWSRAGYSVSGSPANLALMRTVRNGLSRRIALRRPKTEELVRLREEINALEEGDPRRIELEEELDRKLRRSTLIPYIDPLDVRYKRFESHPKPVAQAVMFCLMDVSGSMTEHMKDLAKRFYILLYIFLRRKYKRVEVVFIRHTHQAQEVDEDTFFHSPETGGTVVSTALDEMRRVVAERYSPDSWNIYAAQASDGDNTASDNERTANLLTHHILPISQYYAYLEVGRELGTLPARIHPTRQRSVADLQRDLPRGRADGDAKSQPPTGHLPRLPRVVRPQAGPSRSRDHMNYINPNTVRPLFEGADWEFSTVQRAFAAIETIALGELGLDVYPNQIEVISAEQMLDAYSSVGMPLFYKHWSFGKHFARHEGMYRAGMQGLAYEIVINSNPCISYIMEENTATMQALVIAHAAFGHNHFFKNNYLFRQWTDADGILDYLEFAKSYITKCEERHGEAAVERLLNSAHALMSQGVHRYPRRRTLDLRSEERRQRERREHEEQVFNDLWRTIPTKGAAKVDPTVVERRRALLQLPQENVLFFSKRPRRGSRPGSAKFCGSCATSRSTSIRRARRR